MTVDLEAVKEEGHLLTLDDAMSILRETEPLDDSEFNLDGSDDVEFKLPHGWTDNGMKEAAPDTETNCTVKVKGGDEVRLTKEALLKMTSSIGLTKDYVLRSPGPLIQANLNWWVRHNGVKQANGMRMLSKDGVGVAFMKNSLFSFPNLPLVERVVGSIREKYGDEQLYVDYKMFHSLERTALRIIIPAFKRTLDTARHSVEVPDDWSVGIQLTNSLMSSADTKLNVSGYLFSWWCTNGAISQHATSGDYNRRVQGQDYDDVLDWAGMSTTSVLGDLERELDDVQALTQVSLEGELNDVVKDVFRSMGVPAPARQNVVDSLVESDDLTAYGLMQAVTQAANDPRLSDKVAETTMRVGGVIPHTMSDRCDSCHRLNLR